MKQSFYLPDLGEGLAEAEIIKWYVTEGSQVEEDQPIVSVETAKALVDVPSPVTGTIVRIHVANETIVPTHTLLAEFEMHSAPAAPSPNSTPLEVEPSSVASNDITEEDFQKNRQDEATVVGKMNTTTQVSDDYFIIGKQRPKQPEKTPITNPANRQSTPLLHSHASSSTTLPMSRASALTHQDNFDTETIRGSRKVMAEAMQLSHESVAQVTLFDEADITAWFGKKDITTKLIHAICEASKEVPRLNAWFDMEKRELQIHHHVNLGLAVDTEDGLFVPVLQQINRVPQYKIRSVVDEVIEEVRSRTASPERFKRATISLSNFGAIAGRFATPMVVPPAVAILGAGRLFESPSVQTSKKGKIKVSSKKIMPLSLSFDHRAATGGEGARFLKSIIRELEE